MVNYSFKETINYLSEKLGSNPPQEDIDSGEVELVLDGVTLILRKGQHEGGFEILLSLGFFRTPPSTQDLIELGAANFLGIHTGGCTFYLDKEEVTLSLKVITTAGTSPQQNWETLQSIVLAAQAWSEVLKNKKDFSLLIDLEELEQAQEIKTDSIIKA